MASGIRLKTIQIVREETCCCHMGRKEGNVLFNDTLNTFYLELYGLGHMVKDHSDSERENLLPPYRLLFLINSIRLTARVLLYAPSHRQDITYQGLCYTSDRALAGKRNSSMEPPSGIDPMTKCPMSKLPQSYNISSISRIHGPMPMANYFQTRATK